MSAPPAVLQELVDRFRPDAAEGLSATYQLYVTGEGGGQWHLVIADRRCQLAAGRAESPDVAITLSADDWRAVVAKRLDPVSGLMAGRIQVAGDLSLASRLQTLFGL